jgi:hypothetical protein
MHCASQIRPPRRSRTTFHSIAKTVRRQYRGGRGCLQTTRASNWPRRSPSCVAVGATKNVRVAQLRAVSVRCVGQRRLSNDVSRKSRIDDTEIFGGPVQVAWSSADPAMPCRRSIRATRDRTAAKIIATNFISRSSTPQRLGLAQRLNCCLAKKTSDPGRVLQDFLCHLRRQGD